MNFLPDNYEMPKSSGSYFKIQSGENKLRILTKPILGWLDWMEIPGGGKKPLRYPMDKKPESSKDPSKPMKHFWTFVVWDYKDEGGKIKIWECTQGSVQKAIQNFSIDSDWGSPFNYDIKIHRSGEGMTTQYAVNPVSPKPLENSAKNMFLATPVNLNALYDGLDPFKEVNDSTRVKAYFEASSVMGDIEDMPEDTLTAAQAAELDLLIASQIAPLDSGWKNNFLAVCKVGSVKELPAGRYDWAKRQVTKKAESLKESELLEECPF